MLGQETVPAIVLPPAEPAPAAQPAAPSPVIVLPPTIAEPAAVADEAATRPPAERAPQRAVAKAAPRAASDEVAAKPVAQPPATSAVREATVATVPFAAPETAPVVAERQSDSVRRPIEVPDEIIAASILGVIGLGLAGFVATRRRRYEYEEFDEAVYEPSQEEAAEPPITSIPDELAVRPPFPARVHGDAVEIPEGPVPTGEARRLLLERMMAAPPDSENPFTSPKARRRRARLILQAREQRLRDQATEPFDWRTYRSPASAHPADPAMADA